MKLSEVIVGVSVIAAVEGSAVLGELASATMVGLVTSAPDHDETTHGAVLQALMPVILMATARPDVPPRLVVTGSVLAITVKSLIGRVACKFFLAQSCVSVKYTPDFLG